MRFLQSIRLLPSALLAVLPLVMADVRPTAIKKLTPDSNEKIFPEHLAFAQLSELSLPQAFPPYLDPLSPPEDEHTSPNASTTVFYRRAFAAHIDETHEGLMRRAAEALAILEKRSACPTGMRSCGSIGSPNKCCQDGTYCTDVSDTMVGHVACCPEGSRCGGSVGACPSSAVSCPASLGGGCCIPGFSCQGVGCVSTVTRTLSTTTEEETMTAPTTTEVTTTEEESTSTEVTRTTEEETATRTTTETETGSETGAAPWRPTGTSETTSTQDEDDSSSTQTGCPRGFYGCLATHGGGCCRTDRDCETHSCPAPSTTTTISGQPTVIVPGDEPFPPEASGTCAGGWFLCGANAGPTPGCCPSGYECGTASCFTEQASQTGRVQKEFPQDDAAGLVYSCLFPAYIFPLMAVYILA